MVERPASSPLRRVTRLAVATALAGCAVLGAPPTPGFAASLGDPSFESQVVTLVNEQRAANGCPAVVMDAKLRTAARGHSLDMADKNFFSHTGSNGSSPWNRMSGAGYPGGGSAENIAAGQQTPQAVMVDWMGSPGHRRNILNCDLRALGVGVAVGGTYGIYWTQDFGVVPSTPAPPPPPAPSAQWQYVSNTFGSPATTSFVFGLAGDRPFSCDFDRDGKDSIAVFRSGTFYLRNALSSGASTAVAFGSTGDIPLCGDWNGDGRETIGVYRPGTSTFYLRNSNSAGLSDTRVTLGMVGDRPVAGDWDANGTDTVGVYRPTTAMYYLLNSSTSTAPRLPYHLGLAGDRPVVGDFDGDGGEDLGVRRGSTFYLRTSLGGAVARTFTFGFGTDTGFAGDWDANRVDTVGVSR